ncbi:MAG: tetratricopeptide repeat protein [Alphaproteobacteria bacterium]|nr:tetratricopeptide repeat protein [Alphaproteobacteria bacterium]
MFAIAIGAGVNFAKISNPKKSEISFAGTDFGNFLAMQYAIFADDFNAVEKYSTLLSDTQIKSVQTNRAIAMFVAGKIDDSAGFLKDDKGLSAQITYAAYLIKKGDWQGVYNRFKNNDSQILAPIRIWSAVAVGKSADALKFIDSIKGNDSWRAFIRGQVLSDTGKTDAAKKEFAKVAPDFLNLNDYLYLMAFYNAHGMHDEAENLRISFTERAGGIYILNYAENLGGGENAGAAANLRFSLIQAVSHSPILAYSNMSLLLLRMAEIAGGEALSNDDALNYYLGAFFYNSGSDDKADEFFKRIGPDSLYQPFVLLKNAEKAGNFRQMRRQLMAAIDKNPLFMPAVLKLVDKNLQKGRENDAIRVVNRALGAPGLTEMGRAFLLSLRARIYRQMGNFERADADITHAGDLSPRDIGILSEQARIWAESGKNLDEAYQITLAILKSFPSDLFAWDTLGLIVWQKEGVDDALIIFEKVSRAAGTNSSLFKNLGDAYAELNDTKKAREAYERALELSDDGQISESELRRKIRRLR